MEIYILAAWNKADATKKKIVAAFTTRKAALDYRTAVPADEGWNYETSVVPTLLHEEAAETARLYTVSVDKEGVLCGSVDSRTIGKGEFVAMDTRKYRLRWHMNKIIMEVVFAANSASEAVDLARDWAKSLQREGKWYVSDL